MMNYESMMRLFVALPLAKGIEKKLFAAQQSLSQARTRVTWVAQDCMHITVKFIGDFPISDIFRLSHLIGDSLKGQPPSRLHLKGIDFFPNERSPRVIKVNSVDETELLKHSHDFLDKAMRQLDVPSEDRKYTSHLTLGRIKNTADISTLVRLAGEYREFGFGSMDVSGLTLFASKLDRNGPKYTVIEEFFCD